jgi:hypothetical protein
MTTREKSGYKARSTITASAGTLFNEALAAVQPKELTNTTAIARHAGKILLACDQCGLQFWRKASHTRGARNYCSHSCCGLGQRRRVSCSCVVCGQEFLTWPCAVKNGRSTCGEPSCVLERQRQVSKGRIRNANRVFVAKPKGGEA